MLKKLILFALLVFQISCLQFLYRPTEKPKCFLVSGYTEDTIIEGNFYINWVDPKKYKGRFVGNQLSDEKLKRYELAPPDLSLHVEVIDKISQQKRGKKGATLSKKFRNNHKGFFFTAGKPEETVHYEICISIDTQDYRNILLKNKITEPLLIYYENSMKFPHQHQVFSHFKKNKKGDIGGRLGNGTHESFEKRPAIYDVRGSFEKFIG